MFALLFHCSDFRRNILWEKMQDQNRTEKKWKMAISFLFAWKKRDSVSKSGFATKAEAKAEGEKVRMGMLESRLTYQGVKSDST